MTTLDERLMASLKIFDRLRPSLAGAAPRPDHPRQVEIGPAAERTQATPVIEAQPELLPWPPPLEVVLNNSGQLPDLAVVLGVCEDGLPFLLNLDNPAPGALLLIGDPGAGKNRLLRSLLWSAIFLNPAEQAHFSIIATNPEEWMELAATEHCQEIFSLDSDPCGDLIQEMAALAEIRQHGRYSGPAMLLVIDNLADCLATLDEDDYLRLYWLARHGPRSRIWTLATLTPESAENLDRRFLSAFRSHLVGLVSDPTQAAELANDERLVELAPIEVGQFLVPIANDWLPVWVSDVQKVEDNQ